MSTISLSLPSFMTGTTKMTNSTPPILLVLGSIGVLTTYTVWSNVRQSILEREEQLERQRSAAEFNERYDTWVRAHRERYGGY